MNFGVVDIGSNGIRVLIAQHIGAAGFKEIYSNRAPIRLGEDVFTKGSISIEKQKSLVEAMVEYSNVFKQKKVDGLFIGATSALREAKNHKQLIQQVLDKSGLQITLIDGEHEARLIHKAVAHELKIKSGKNLLLDIGGGSCEFVLSEGDRYLNYVSLKAGAVRLVKDINMHKPYLSREYLESIIQTYIDDLGDFKDFIKQPDHGFIATGGNARSLNKLSRIVFNHSNRAFITQNQIEMLVAIVFGFSHDDRVTKLDLRADRVDVILPASLLILKTMQTFGFDKVLTPKIGLRHGMLLELLSKFPEQRR